MPNVLLMTELTLSNKRVAIREDLNVPIKNGEVTSDTRILACLPGIRFALDAGASVILLSHLGRPKEGEYQEEFSLAPVAKRLSEFLEQEVRLEKDYLNGLDVQKGEVVLCENVRFNKGEKSNDEALGKAYAALCDVFVMDAFGTAHRAQASTSAAIQHAAVACAGPLLAAELEALSKSFVDAEPPLVAVIGGSKVSTKLGLLSSLVEKADGIIVGGGLANNFLLAMGYNIGASLCEPDLLDETRKILDLAQNKPCALPLPVDVYVAKRFSEDSPATLKTLAEIEEDDMILDVGPHTSQLYDELLTKAKAIIWNGPVGCFEFEQFSQGTKRICATIEQSKAFTVAGGGDTLAAVEKFGAVGNISYLSTGGGAFLEFLEGKTLPSVAQLEKRAKGDV